MGGGSVSNDGIISSKRQMLSSLKTQPSRYLSPSPFPSFLAPEMTESQITWQGKPLALGIFRELRVKHVN